MLNTQNLPTLLNNVHKISVMYSTHWHNIILLNTALGALLSFSLHLPAFQGKVKMKAATVNSLYIYILWFQQICFILILKIYIYLSKKFIHKNKLVLSCFECILSIFLHHHDTIHFVVFWYFYSSLNSGQMVVNIKIAYSKLVLEFPNSTSPITNKPHLKGAVSRDFRTLFFFINRTHLGPW